MAFNQNHVVALFLKDTNLHFIVKKNRTIILHTFCKKKSKEYKSTDTQKQSPDSSIESSFLFSQFLSLL